MSSSGLNARFKKHLKPASMHKGHTLHGVKRSRIRAQHDIFEDGESVDEQASWGRHRHVHTLQSYAHSAYHRGRMLVNLGSDDEGDLDAERDRGCATADLDL